MAYYALINKENKVEHVISGVDENETQIDLDGSIVGGSSENWEMFYSQLNWFSGLYCKRTSYNNKIRKQFAAIGYTYDPENDIFISPQPYPSWTLDDNFDWQPPKPMPSDGFWYWDEELGEWINGETV